jgi:hypothetical protein
VCTFDPTPCSAELPCIPQYPYTYRTCSLRKAQLVSVFFFSGSRRDFWKELFEACFAYISWEDLPVHLLNGELALLVGNLVVGNPSVT